MTENKSESSQSTQFVIIVREQAKQWMQSAIESHEPFTTTQVRVFHILLNLNLVKDHFLLAGLPPSNLKLIDNRRVNLVDRVIQTLKVFAVLPNKIAR